MKTSMKNKACKIRSISTELQEICHNVMLKLLETKIQQLPKKRKTKYHIFCVSCQGIGLQMKFHFVIYLG